MSFARLPNLMELKRYQGERYFGWVQPDFHPPAQILEFPESIVEIAGAEHLLDCEARQIFRLPLQLGAKSQPCFTYYFKNSSLHRCLRQSYAFRVLEISQKLTAQRVATLEVVAALKKRGELVNRRSFLVAREIENVREMPSAGNHVFHVHPVAEFSSFLAAALAGDVARLHDLGFFHGDLKTRHILVQPDRDSRPRFYFVDLEKCVHRPQLPALVKDILAARDLIQLFASLPSQACSMCEIFLDQYLRSRRLSRQRHRRLTGMVGLYRPGGSLKQGETLLTGLLKKLFH